MDDKIPYAKMLEDGIKKLTEGKAQNAVLCGLLEDGTTCVAYANASPEDLANIACHLLSEAFMRTVIVNIDMIKDALDEYEDGTAQLSVMSGVPVCTIRSLECNVSRSGRIDTLELLADALGISIDEDEYVGHKVMVKNHA